MKKIKLKQILCVTIVSLFLMSGQVLATDTSEDAWVDDGNDVIFNGGNVGIGLGANVAPESLLHLPVDSSIQTGDTYISSYLFTGYNERSILANTGYLPGGSLNGFDDGAYMFIEDRDTVFGSYDGTGSTATEHMRIDAENNRIGIGTPTPQSELDVNGTVTTKAVNVNNNYIILEPGLTLTADTEPGEGEVNINQAGTTFILKPGDYYIRYCVVLTEDKISIIGSAGTVLRKVWDEGSRGEPLIAVNGDRCVFKNFEYDGTTGRWGGFVVTGKYNKFDKLYIHNFISEVAFALYACKHTHITNCIIEDIGATGIMSANATNSYISGNTIERCSGEGINLDWASKGCIVTGNTLSNHGGAAAIAGDGTSYCIITNNIIDSAQYVAGISLGPYSHLVVEIADGISTEQNIADALKEWTTEDGREVIASVENDDNIVWNLTTQANWWEYDYALLTGGNPVNGASGNLTGESNSMSITANIGYVNNGVQIILVDNDIVTEAGSEPIKNNIQFYNVFATPPPGFTTAPPEITHHNIASFNAINNSPTSSSGRRQAVNFNNNYHKYQSEANVAIGNTYSPNTTGCTECEPDDFSEGCCDYSVVMVDQNNGQKIAFNTISATNLDYVDIYDVLGNLTLYNSAGNETIYFGSNKVNYLFDSGNDIKWHNSSNTYTIDKTQD